MMSKLELENLKESVIEQKTKLNSIITNIEHQSFQNNFKSSYDGIQSAYVNLSNEINKFVSDLDNAIQLAPE